MISYSFRLFILSFILNCQNRDGIARRRTKMYLIKVRETKSNDISRGNVFRDYKSEYDDDYQKQIFKRTKPYPGNDNFLNKMRKELGIMKGFFRSSSSRKGIHMVCDFILLCMMNTTCRGEETENGHYTFYNISIEQQ